MYCAWTTYKANQGQRSRTAEARKQLTQALALNPKLGLAHLYLGYIHKDEGEEKETRRSFEKAIRCNPDCTEALRELRLMNMRREKAEKEKKKRFGPRFK